MDELQTPIRGPDVTPQPPIIPTAPAKSSLGLVVKIVVGVVVVAVVAVVVIGTLLATRIWDPLWNPFRPNPEKVIKQAITKIFELKSLHSNISFSGAAGSEEVKYSFSGKIEGDSEITDPSDFNFDSGFEFKTATQMPSNPLIPGMQIALAGNLKKIGDTQYFKINSFPVVFSLYLPPQIQTLENKWIKTDSESYKKIMEMAQSLGGEPAGVNVPLDEMMEKSKNFQKDLGERIKNILKEKQFYSADKELPDEKIEGKKVYHYKVSLKPAETGETIAEILKAVEEETLKAFGTGPAYPESAEIKKKVEEMFNKIGGISAEIWIGKKDGYIYKIKFDKEIDLNQLATAPATAFSSKALLKLGLEANFSRFGQTIKIEPPAEFTAIEDVILPLIEESLKDSKIKSYLSSITGQMRQYSYQKKTFYGITCKSPEISSYCSGIKKITGKDPVISVSKSNYCVFSELFSKEDGKTKYYCLSNQYYYGSGGETTINPGGRGYCDGKTFVCPPATTDILY